MTWRTSLVCLLLGLSAALLSCSAQPQAVTPAAAPEARPPTPTPVITVAPDGSTEVRVYMRAPAGDHQEGTAVLRSLGEKTVVVVTLSPPKPSAQPMHIHTGDCRQTLGPVVTALEAAIRGESTTLVNKPLSEILIGGQVINVHESFADFNTSTACGVLPAISGRLGSPQPPATSSGY